MEIKIENDKYIIVVEDALCIENIVKIKKELLTEIPNDRDIIVDMINVKCMDSSGLGVLVALVKKQKSFDKEVSLININKGLFDLLKISSFDKFFKLM